MEVLVVVANLVAGVLVILPPPPLLLPLLLLLLVVVLVVLLPLFGVLPSAPGQHKYPGAASITLWITVSSSRIVAFPLLRMAANREALSCSSCFSWTMFDAFPGALLLLLLPLLLLEVVVEGVVTALEGMALLLVLLVPDLLVAVVVAEATAPPLLPRLAALPLLLLLLLLLLPLAPSLSVIMSARTDKSASNASACSPLGSIARRNALPDCSVSFVMQAAWFFCSQALAATSCCISCCGTVPRDICSSAGAALWYMLIAMTQVSCRS
jgi:hypothetical protein